MKSKPFKLDLQMFAEDQKSADESQAEKTMSANDYVEAIEKLKESTVSKEDYEALKADNKELLNAVLNGGSLKSGSAPVNEVKPDIKKLREELYGGKTSLSNLEIAKKSLELRKALMDEGEIDPFVPVGQNISPEPLDFEKAQQVADVLEECIEKAEGDSGVFTNLLQLKMIDANPRVSMPKFLKKK